MQAAPCHQLGACWRPLRSGEPWAGVWNSLEPGSTAPRSLPRELRHAVAPRRSLIDVRDLNSGSEVRMPGKHFLSGVNKCWLSQKWPSKGVAQPHSHVYICA